MSKGGCVLILADAFVYEICKLPTYTFLKGNLRTVLFKGSFDVKKHVTLFQHLADEYVANTPTTWTETSLFVASQSLTGFSDYKFAITPKAY